MTTYKFRPQELPKRLIIKTRLNGYDSTVINYNFQQRRRRFPVDYRLNEKTLSKIFSRLHYLACHSPKKVAKQYTKAYNNFGNKYFARRGNASTRYLNTWTAHSWL